MNNCVFFNRFPALNTLSGVIAVTPDQFEKINGYSNKFWGWGAEDLDFLNRSVELNI